MNLVYVGKEVRLNFSNDFYARYRHGKYLDYFPLAAALVESPPEGRVLAFESRIVCALSDVDATTASTQFSGVLRASTDGVEDHAYLREIHAIVVDPVDDTSARLLYAYLQASPGWHASRFGRLALYLRPTPPAPHPDVTP